MGALVQLGGFNLSEEYKREEMKNVLSAIQKEFESIRKAIPSTGVSQTATAGQTLTIVNGIITKVE